MAQPPLYTVDVGLAALVVVVVVIVDMVVVVDLVVVVVDDDFAAAKLLEKPGAFGFGTYFGLRMTVAGARLTGGGGGGAAMRTC